MKAKLLMLVVATMFASTTNAQKVKIDAQLLIDDELPDQEVVVQVIDKDGNMTEFSSMSSFKANLEYDNKYKIIFYADGCQTKYIEFDTNAPDKRKLRYVFNVSLKKTTDQQIVQAGGVYYDKKKQQFSYYLN